MAQLRASRTTRLQAKLALVNANREADAFRNHPTIPTYVEGCESRAAKRHPISRIPDSEFQISNSGFQKEKRPANLSTGGA